MRLIPSNPPNVTDRAVRRAWTAVAAVALIILVGGVTWLVRLSLENDAQERSIAESDAARDELSERLDNEHAAAQTLAEQVKRLGGKPAVEPGEAPAGPPGPAPTQTQVRAAVADYCAGDRCKPVVTRSQVNQAVANYCANGACRGRDGVSTDGTDGKPGADGTDGTDGTDGPPGPGPTDEQIAQAVADYCADSKCVGKPGADGKDGTSITDVTCDRGTGTFVFTFSDGTTRTVECSPVG